MSAPASVSIQDITPITPPPGPFRPVHAGSARCRQRPILNDTEDLTCLVERPRGLDPRHSFCGPPASPVHNGEFHCRQCHQPGQAHRIVNRIQNAAFVVLNRHKRCPPLGPQTARTRRPAAPGSGTTPRKGTLLVALLVALSVILSVAFPDVSVTFTGPLKVSVVTSAGTAAGSSTGNRRVTSARTLEGQSSKRSHTLEKSIQWTVLVSGSASFLGQPQVAVRPKPRHRGTQDPEPRYPSNAPRPGGPSTLSSPYNQFTACQ